MSIKYVFNPTTGNLDATDKVAFNGEVNAGSAASPSIFFTGDTNTGIYSPGADQLALSTNGTGRVFIDSSGRVGVGTANPTQPLEVTGGFIKNDTGTLLPTARYAGASGGAYISTNGTDNPIQFVAGTANTERLRITSAGLVGIGTSSPGSLLHLNSGASDLFVRMEARGANALESSFLFLTKNSAGTNTGGSIGYDGNTNTLYLTSDTSGGATQHLSITNTGRVGIGTTSALRLWHVLDSANSIVGRVESGQSSSWLQFAASGNGTASRIGSPDGASTASLAFMTNDQERARIDSSGRLLVGTSTALTNIYVGAAATTPQIQLSGAGLPESSLSLLRTGATGATIFLNAGSSGNNVIDGSIAGRLVFNGYDGTNYRTSAQITAEVDGTPGANDMPGRLVFSTTADGASSPTERMRISENGRVSIGATTKDYQLEVANPSSTADATARFADTATTASVNAAATATVFTAVTGSAYMVFIHRVDSSARSLFGMVTAGSSTSTWTQLAAGPSSAQFTITVSGLNLQITNDDASARTYAYTSIRLS